MAKNEETAIRALIERRRAALRAGDTEAATAPLSKDVISYDLQPPLQFAGAEARDPDALAQWLSTWDGPVDIDMPDPHIVAEGDLAFVHGLSRMRGAKRGHGPILLWFRTTAILRRVNDKWSIVHEHNSVPMKMDGSGLAATDLEP